MPNVQGEVPQDLCGIQTPLVKAEWVKELSNHPDQKYAQYLIQDITEGFRVGFRYGDGVCRSAESNMQSAQRNPEVIDNYLAKEVRLGRIVVRRWFI